MELVKKLWSKIRSLISGGQFKSAIAVLSEISGLPPEHFSAGSEPPVKGLLITLEFDEDRKKHFLVLTPGDGVKYAEDIHFKFNQIETQINRAVYGSSGYTGTLIGGYELRYEVDDALKEFLKFSV